MVLAGLALLAQQEAVRRHSFEQRPALLMENDKLSLTVLTQGATFADLTLRDDPEKLSPIWNPARLAREVGETPRFGASFGHFVCVDGFGPTSKEERAAGLDGHGEAHRQTMDVVSARKESGVTSLAMTAKLPVVQEVLTRTMRLRDGENVVLVESQLESLLGFDRPINWAEHATIGSPFLEPGVTVVDHSGTRSQTRPYDGGTGGPAPRRLVSGAEFTWPMAPTRDGKTVDLRIAPKELRALDHSTTLLDPTQKYGWVTALHPQKRLVLGYLFLREEYPWMQYWGWYPPTGKLARGLEFGTQPYDVPRREAISNGTMFGVPTYRWLPAKSKIGTRFLMFYGRVPTGLGQVDSVRLEGGAVVVEQKGGQQARFTTGWTL